MVGCGQTSAKWLPSTMPSPPSTQLNGPRERRSSALVREDGACVTPTKVKLTRRPSSTARLTWRGWKSSTLVTSQSKDAEVQRQRLHGTFSFLIQSRHRQY